MRKIIVGSMLLLIVFFMSASQYAINTIRAEAPQKVKLSSKVITLYSTGLPLKLSTPLYNPSLNPNIVYVKIKSEPGSLIRINGVDRSYVDGRGILETPLTLEDQCSGENLYSIVSIKNDTITQKQLYINTEC